MKNIQEFIKVKYRYTRRKIVLDPVVIVFAWFIALALIYMVMIKFSILNSF